MAIAPFPARQAGGARAPQRVSAPVAVRRREPEVPACRFRGSRGQSVPAGRAGPGLRLRVRRAPPSGRARAALTAFHRGDAARRRLRAARGSSPRPGIGSDHRQEAEESDRPFTSAFRPSRTSITSWDLSTTISGTGHLALANTRRWATSSQATSNATSRPTSRCHWRSWPPAHVKPKATRVRPCADRDEARAALRPMARDPGGRFPPSPHPTAHGPR